MIDTEAFRVCVVPRSKRLSADQLIRTKISVERRIATIFQAIGLHKRLKIEFLYEGELWALVFVEPSPQIALDLEISRYADACLSSEGTTASNHFRKFIDDLVFVIRQAHVDQYGLDDLEHRALEARGFLRVLSSASSDAVPREMLTVIDPANGQWSVVVPTKSKHPRVSDEVVTVEFQVEAAGQDFAWVRLSARSKTALNVNERKTRIFWTCLSEGDRATSDQLYDYVHTKAVLKAVCLQIRSPSGNLKGLALVEVVVPSEVDADPPASCPHAVIH